MSDTNVPALSLAVTVPPSDWATQSPRTQQITVVADRSHEESINDAKVLAKWLWSCSRSDFLFALLEELARVDFEGHMQGHENYRCSGYTCVLQSAILSRVAAMVDAVNLTHAIV